MDKGVIEGENTVLGTTQSKGTIRVERKGRNEFTWVGKSEDGEDADLAFTRVENPQRQKKAEK